MSTKRAKTNRFEVLSAAEINTRRSADRPAPGDIFESGKARGNMLAKSSTGANEYLCAIERNQNGKYNIRVRAIFGPAKPDTEDLKEGQGSKNNQSGWTLPIYFLASSFNAGMKKLEASLQLLQKNEERLRFWGVERTDDPNVAGDLLRGLGLWLDRRRDFPRKVAELGVARERPVPASLLAPVRRLLADSVAQERTFEGAALAGD